MVPIQISRSLFNASLQIETLNNCGQDVANCKDSKNKGRRGFNSNQTQAMKDIHNHIPCPAVEEKPKNLGMSYYHDLWEILKSHEKSSKTLKPTFFTQTCFSSFLIVKKILIPREKLVR